MSVIQRAQQERFLAGLARGEGDVLAVLAYGGDTGGVRELGERLVKAVLGTRAEDPFSLVTLDEEALREDPGLLADEAQAISMFGGRRVVRVRNAGNAFLQAVKELLKLPAVEAFIVAEAPGLKKDSALARLFSKEKRLAALPVYADGAADVQALVDAVLREHGLEMERDARMALTHLLGGDRMASRNELEKLALYCRGQERVTLQDVEAVCSDVSAHATSDMLDAYFTGDAVRGGALLQGILAEGMPGAALLASAAKHVALLKDLRQMLASGMAAREAVKQYRPMIFFRRHESIMRQLRAWTEPRLARADESIWQATLASRRMPELEAELAERCLLTLALQVGRKLHAA